MKSQTLLRQFLLFSLILSKTTKNYDSPCCKDRSGTDFDKFRDMEGLTLEFKRVQVPCNTSIAQEMWYKQHIHDFHEMPSDEFVNGKKIIELPFVFDFFEEKVQKLAITNQSTIESMTKIDWAIAPFLGDFDTNHGWIEYFANVVRWENIRLQHGYLKEEFTFQVCLESTGAVKFFYQSIPRNLYYVQDNINGFRQYFGVGYQHEEFSEDASIDEYFLYGFGLDINVYVIQDWTLVTIEHPRESLVRTSCTGRSAQKGRLTNSLLAFPWPSYHEMRERKNRFFNEKNRHLLEDSIEKEKGMTDNEPPRVFIRLCNPHWDPRRVEKIWDNSQKDDFIEIPAGFFNTQIIVELPFTLRFFEKNIAEVAITNQGTIESTSEVNWVIAPLLADLDARNGWIGFHFIEDGLVVRWESIRLISDNLKKEFSFQVILLGRQFIFIYKQIPFDLRNAHDKLFKGFKPYFGAGYRKGDIPGKANKRDYFLSGFDMDIEEYVPQKWTLIKMDSTKVCVVWTSCAGYSSKTSRSSDNQVCEISSPIN